MTSTRVYWDPLFPILPLIIPGILILAALIILEWKRRQRFLSLRIILQVLIVLSLLGLVMRPQFPAHQKMQSLLLLTKGFQPRIADSLIKSSPGLKIIQTVGSAEYPKAAPLESINELPVIGADIDFILGEGLPHYALELISKKKYRYFPAPTPEGIIGLDYPKRYYANRWNKINGLYHLNSNTRRLKLMGPGGTDDSVRITGSGIVPFSISFFAKTTGKVTYQLIDQDTLTKEENVHPLPLEILPENKLSIVLINYYPTFEHRYLKNFLIASGHRLAIRNQISRDRFRYEFANRPAMSMSSLDDLLLNNTDLLIIDSPSWQSLSGSEKHAVELAVANGLGLLILPDLSVKDKYLQKLFGWKSLKNQPDTASFSLPRSGNFNLPVLPLSIQQTHSPLLRGKDGRTLTGFVFATAGKIGFQLLQETYQLGLQEKKEAYAAIWVPLLEGLVREIQTPSKLTIISPFPWIENEPVSLEVINSGGEPILSVDSIPLPLIEDIHMDDLWYGRVWMEGDGWHRLMLDTTAYHLPLVAADDWGSMRVARQMKANHIHQNGKKETQDADDLVLGNGAGPLFLFVIFIVASGVLWFVPKW